MAKSEMAKSDLSLNEHACTAYMHKTTTRLIHCNVNAMHLSMYAFNSCSFNYKSDYSINIQYTVDIHKAYNIHIRHTIVMRNQYIIGLHVQLFR